MCFRDRSFCSDSGTCAVKDCVVKFTDKDHESAVKWWGADNYPLCISPFKGTDRCVGYVSETDVTPLPNGEE